MHDTFRDDEVQEAIQIHTPKQLQLEAVLENTSYIKEQTDFSKLETRGDGEYFRRRLAEFDAVQALAKLRMLQEHPSSPPLGSLPTASPNLNERKKPIKFKDAVGRKFSFPFELCCTWQVSNNFNLQYL